MTDTDSHLTLDTSGPLGDRVFALHSGESLGPGMRRIALGQLDDAIELVGGGDDGHREDAVHEARKALKRLRALARLLRDELGEERYRLENATLRDVARELAGARDAEVLVETLEGLIERHPSATPADGFAALRAELVVERHLASQRLVGDASVTDQVAGELRAVRDRVGDWVGSDAGFDAVAPGLRRIYRQGGERYRQARRDPSAERLHEWRKRVKDLRHAGEVLAPAGRDRMSWVAKTADRLGETLGEDHDLAVLDDLVRDRRELFRSKRDRRALRGLIARRRAKLQRRAMRLGRELYRDGPDRFVARTARDWLASSAVS